MDKVHYYSTPSQDISLIQAQYQEFAFQRHFKNKMGMTPYAWLSRLRMEQGMRLIKSGVGGTEVAHQVGFYDQAHFSKAFKTAFGVSPSKIN